MKKANSLSPSEKLAIVNEYRKHAPVDVEGLAGALGVNIHRAYLPQDISGMIEPSSAGNYVITVNAGDAPTRQRFTVAHELAHFILHETRIGSGIDDDRTYRSTDAGRYHNTTIGPREETEANKIAAAILMPYDLIAARKEDGVDDVGQLANEFGVSRHAMSIRLGVPYNT